MNVVFLGSSKYSTIDEQLLHQALGLCCVVTLPDRIDSKTKQSLPNPVKKYAEENNIPVITTEKITPEIVDQLKQYAPDFLVVADFGLILPKTLLELPKEAALNVHHSLLPKYRGPSPVPSAILAGETTLGVTVMLMSQKVDAGDILAQTVYELQPTDTSDSVLTKLNQLGGNLAVQVIKNFDDYYTKRTPQDESLATFTHFMSRNDGYIDINPKSETRNPKQIQSSNAQNTSNFDIRDSNFPVMLNRAVRAYFPWPGVWFVARIKDKEVRIKVLPPSCHPELDCGSRPLLQVEGKKPMSYKDFMNGYTEGKEILEKLKLVS